jgi:NAD(P)-dependent dehydrogenase (short-subunit alcohol dehydrogenase family)
MRSKKKARMRAFVRGANGGMGRAPARAFGEIMDIAFRDDQTKMSSSEGWTANKKVSAYVQRVTLQWRPQ